VTSPVRALPFPRLPQLPYVPSGRGTVPGPVRLIKASATLLLHSSAHRGELRAGLAVQHVIENTGGQ
jgi:hypothetical protein